MASFAGSQEPADIPLYLSSGTGRRIGNRDAIGYYLFLAKQDGNGIAHFVVQPPERDSNGFYNINVRVVGRSGTTPLQIDRFSQHPLSKPRQGATYTEMDFRGEETHLTDAESLSAMKEDLLRRFDETAQLLDRQSTGEGYTGEALTACRETLDQIKAHCLPDDRSKQMTALRTEPVRFGGQPTTLARALAGFVARAERVLTPASGHGAADAENHAANKTSTNP